MKKDLITTYCLSLFVTVQLIAAPADSIIDGPTIGGSVSNDSKNEGTTISIGGGKFSTNKAGISKQDGVIGDLNGTQTNIGNIEVTKGRVRDSIINSSDNKGTVINIGTKVNKGSIKMTKGSVGSISNNAKNEGTTVSIGGGELNIKTEVVSDIKAKLGSVEGTETNIGSIDIDGGSITNEVTNAGMKNSGTTVNVGGVVNKGSIHVKGGKALSIDNASQNSGTIVNIAGGSFSNKSLAGINDMSVEVGNVEATQTDVGSIGMKSGQVIGSGGVGILNKSENKGTVINIGSTVKEGSIQIGD